MISIILDSSECTLVCMIIQSEAGLDTHHDIRHSTVFWNTWISHSPVHLFPPCNPETPPRSATCSAHTVSQAGFFRSKQPAHYTHTHTHTVCNIHWDIGVSEWRQSYEQSTWAVVSLVTRWWHCYTKVNWELLTPCAAATHMQFKKDER